MAELGAFFGNPNVQRQGARARALAAQRDVNTLPDPRTYAAVQGLLGTRPDEMGFSILNPDYQSIRDVADPAFAIGSLLQIAPMAKVLNAPAAAIGKAVAPTVDRIVTNALERGGLPAEMLQAMGTNTRSLLDVYHGTPHTLPPTAKNPLGEFDASKIGTGEGAQAYGYGTYVAENPDVAKSYVKTGMRPIFKVGDENITPVKNPTTPEEKARNYIYDNAETAMVESVRKPSAQSLLNESWMDAQFSFKDEELSAVRKEIARLIETKGKKVLKNQEGSLYKVDLPDEQIAKMLDFDKPLKDQTSEIQTLAKQYGLTDADHLGGDLVAAMDAKRPAGAEAMRQAGITGIKYFDEGSRGVGKGTRNFVVFPSEEKSMTILERNGLLADQFQALPDDKKKEILNLLE